MAEIEIEDAIVTNATEGDEVDWYTPVAVILKPASERDLKKRFKANEDRVDPPTDYDGAYQSSRLAWPPTRELDSFNPFWPNPYDWQTPYQGDDGQDRLREVYQAYDVPTRVQGNLLSLARMGLVAIPRKEVNHAGDDDTTSETELGIFSDLIKQGIIEFLIELRKKNI